MLEPYTLIADRLCRLNEGAADIVIADDAEFVGDVGLAGETDCRRYAGIRHRDDHIGRRRRLTRELRAHGLAHIVDVAAADD